MTPSTLSSVTWLAVARREALDVRRSRGLRAIVVVLAAVSGAAVLLPALVVGDSLTAAEALGYLAAPLKLVVGLAALLAGHAAIAGPRSGGQLKLVLGLPVDRTALVAGAFVGRTAVVLVGTGVGVVVVATAMPVLYGQLPVARLAGFAGLLALLATAMTALAVGLSAASRTRSRAAVAAVAAFVCFEFFWGVVPAGAHYLAEGALPGPVVPAWVVGLERLQPLAAFEVATQLVLPGVDQSVQLSSGGATTATGPRTLADRLTGPIPAYLDPWAAVLTLVAWTVGPLLLGWYRFVRADL